MVRKVLFHVLPGLLLLASISPVFAADTSLIEGEALQVQEGDESAEDGAGTEAEESPAAESGADASGDVELSIFQELKTVENQVDALKEKVFRSKARLLLLEEKVILFRLGRSLLRRTRKVTLKPQRSGSG